MDFSKALEALKSGKSVYRDTPKKKDRSFIMKDGDIYEYFDSGYMGNDITLSSEDVMANDWQARDIETASNAVIFKNKVLTVNGAVINMPYELDIRKYERLGIAKVRLTLTTDIKNIAEYNV